MVSLEGASLAFFRRLYAWTVRGVRWTGPAGDARGQLGRLPRTHKELSNLLQQHYDAGYNQALRNAYRRVRDLGELL
jgi:hypothetical protein